VECCKCEHGKRPDRCKICLKEKNRKGDFCDHGLFNANCGICSDCGHGKVKANCGICSDCGHGKIKGSCGICSDCGHGKIKGSCGICSDCGHGKLSKNCILCNPNISCKSEFCYTLVSDKEKYDGYCTRCFVYFFPKDKRIKEMRAHTKELRVLKYLTKNTFLDIDGKDFIHDKIMYTGNCNCSHRRRIDFRMIINNTLLCIECDEKQHKSYGTKDEEVRYDDLFMVFGGKWIFIRYNPDSYKINNRKYNPKNPYRMKVLKKEIEKQIQRINNYENTEMLEIVKLFFDK
jgi:hypothetical protein